VKGCAAFGHETNGGFAAAIPARSLAGVGRIEPLADASAVLSATDLSRPF
jgi:hypothetical protein